MPRPDRELEAVRALPTSVDAMVAKSSGYAIQQQALPTILPSGTGQNDIAHENADKATSVEVYGPARSSAPRPVGCRALKLFLRDRIPDNQADALTKSATDRPADWCRKGQYRCRRFEGFIGCRRRRCYYLAILSRSGRPLQGRFHQFGSGIQACCCTLQRCSFHRCRIRRTMEL